MEKSSQAQAHRCRPRGTLPSPQPRRSRGTRPKGPNPWSAASLARPQGRNPWSVASLARPQGPPPRKRALTALTNNYKPNFDIDALSVRGCRSSSPTQKTGLSSPVSPSRRPSRTCVEGKSLASRIFPGAHVDHLYGLWLGPRNEGIVVQQQNRFDYPHEVSARHRFWHRDRYGQGIRSKAAIHDQGITCQLLVFLKDRVNARIDYLE